MEMLHERLLSSAHRVAEGPADLYFVPVTLSDVPTQKAKTRVAKALEYISQNFPFWNQTGGGYRHVLTLPSLGGLCGFGSNWSSSPLARWLQHVTVLTTYGYSSPQLRCHRPGQDLVIPDLDATPLLFAKRFAGAAGGFKKYRDSQRVKHKTVEMKVQVSHTRRSKMLYVIYGHEPCTLGGKSCRLNRTLNSTK